MFEQAFKNIDNVLRNEAGCQTELDYTEQTSWLLFLKYLDDLEEERAMRAELESKNYERIIDEPHRWSSPLIMPTIFCKSSKRFLPIINAHTKRIQNA